MAVVLHLVGLVIGSARVVHHHDECAVDFAAHRLLVELFRCVLAGLAHLFAILILMSVGELLHRLAQRDAKHAIDVAQHLGLASLNGLRRGLRGNHFAQLQAVFAQLR